MMTPAQHIATYNDLKKNGWTQMTSIKHNNYSWEYWLHETKPPVFVTIWNEVITIFLMMGAENYA